MGFQDRVWASVVCGTLALVPILAAQQPSQTESDALLQQGSTAMQRGDLQASETAFRRATQAFPNRSEAFLGLGLVELREGNADEALASLSKAASLNPHLGGPHLFLGIANYQVGRTVESIANLRAELALNPDSSEAATWLVIVLLANAREAEALPIIDHAVALQPENTQLLYLQAKAHGSVAKAALARLYALDPDGALVHEASAENYAGAGDTDKAIAEYQAALLKQPDSPDILEALGDAQQRGGHTDDAAVTFAQELKINPKSPVALYDLGRIEVESGKPADGIKLLRRAQAAHASASPTEYYLGLGLAETGQNEEAAQYLLSSLQHGPPPFVQQGAWYQLARIYGKLGRKTEQQDALAHLQEVLEAKNREKEAQPKSARTQTSSPQPDRP